MRIEADKTVLRINCRVSLVWIAEKILASVLFLTCQAFLTTEYRTELRMPLKFEIWQILNEVAKCVTYIYFL